MNKEDKAYMKLMIKSAKDTNKAQTDYINWLAKNGASYSQAESLNSVGPNLLPGPMFKPVFEELQKLPLKDQLELQAQPKVNPDEWGTLNGGMLESDYRDGVPGAQKFINEPKNIQELLYPTRKS
jgi:hypothetical protein